jgi:hypothetical protein
MIDPYYIEQAEDYGAPEFEDPEATEEFMDAVEEMDDMEGDEPLEEPVLNKDDLDFLDVLDDPDGFAMALALGDELSQDQVNKKLLKRLGGEAEDFVDEAMGIKRLSLKDRKSMRSEGASRPPHVSETDFVFFKFVRDVSTGRKKLGDPLV